MTAVLQKKICMLGGFSVGKTSLVKRYVQSVFSETYLTTVGVKIDKKTVDLSDRIVNLILWDLAGEDDINTFRMTNMRGAAGYVLVADGTRPSTLDVALSLRQRVEAEYGPLPFVLLLNKSDLKEQWAIGDAEVEGLRQNGCWVQPSSARTGEGVEDACEPVEDRRGSHRAQEICYRLHECAVARKKDRSIQAESLFHLVDPPRRQSRDARQVGVSTGHVRQGGRSNPTRQVEGLPRQHQLHPFQRQ